MAMKFGVEESPIGAGVEASWTPKTENFMQFQKNKGCGLQGLSLGQFLIHFQGSWAG